MARYAANIMKNLVLGHKYELKNFEKTEEKGQILQFIHKEPALQLVQEGKIENDPSFTPATLITVSDGTTNEEVIEALIDRISFLQDKFPCKENACCITHLQEALMWLEKRTSDRLKRNVEGKQLL